MKQSERRENRAARLTVGAVLTIFLHLTPSSIRAEDLTFEQFHGNAETSIRLDENTRLRMIQFTSPELTIFKDAVGWLREKRASLASAGTEDFPGNIRITGTSINGMIFMPNYPGYDYATIRETADAREEGRAPEPIPRSEIEKTLAVFMYRIKTVYSLSRPLGMDNALNLQLKKDLFARAAYNLYDFAPMLDYAKEGLTVVDAFARYYTGGSFFRLNDTTSASLGMDFGESRAIAAFWRLTVTDLSYTDQSVGIEYVWKNRLVLLGAYDFSSYDTYNGLACDKFRLQADLSLGASTNFIVEAVYRPSGSDAAKIPVQIALAILSRPGSNENKEDAPNPLRDAERMAEIRDVSGDITREQVPKLYVTEINKDIHAILDVKDRSFRDVLGIFSAYDGELDRYDSSRAANIFSQDRLSGRDPEDYLDKGGVCIDSAKFIATVLANNDLETKIITVGSLRSSPHVYVVARDERGAYYTVDGFSYVNKIDSADSFQSAAAIYQQSFTQMVQSDASGRIEAVIVSPEMELLDALLFN